MHVLEGILRAKDGDIERTADWWKGLMESSTAFEKTVWLSTVWTGKIVS